MKKSAKTKALTRAIKKKEQRKPEWGGPIEEGITQSLLSSFLACRERFRLRVVEGLRVNEGFSKALEYGNMWHICEEHHALGQTWELGLKAYAQDLVKQYQTQQDEVEKWYNICRRQFPIYIKWWEKHPDVKKREPLLAEEVFCVPYTLPSGRIVKMKGMWDSVDIVQVTKKKRELWLQENKTKGQIEEISIENQLSFDKQSMFYVIALQTAVENGDVEFPLNRVQGVRYNVVRRPLSGGKDSIRQHKPTKSNPKGESLKEYYDRLQGRMEDDPEHYFKRWNMEISTNDIDAFKTQFLNPILEQLCDWWEYIIVDPFNPWRDHNTDQGIHWRHPYGNYNAVDQNRDAFVEYLRDGNKAGLTTTTELFPELQ